MNKPKHAEIAMAILITVSIIGAVYAAYWVYSNIAKVTFTPPQYVLTLQAAQSSDTEITLTATLTIKHYGSSDPKPVEGAQIHFYLVDSSGEIIEELGTAETNEYGTAVYVWTVPSSGAPEPVDYYFKAGYYVTP